MPIIFLERRLSDSGKLNHGVNMNRKIILPLLLLISHLHSQQEKLTTEYIEENAKISIGTVSEKAIIAKSFIGLFTTHGNLHNGAIASSWNDFAELGFDLDSFERDMGVDFAETYAFASGESVSGKVPVMSNRSPIDYREDGSLGRYVVWLDEAGSYYFSKVPEEEIEALFSKYKVKLLEADSSSVQSPIPETPTPPAVVTETTEELSTVKSGVKEPAEVKPVEVAEETPEKQSSQWWLWLIGALVLVGGLAAVVRRKS